MNAVKLILIALAAAAIVGCSPRRAAPETYNENLPQTGNDNEISEIESGDLNANDVRENTSTDQKVGDWITNNSIPAEAVLCTVYFGYDKFNVSSGERSKLDAIAQQANKDGIYIIGYSDFYGSEEYNLALSDKRAQAVKKYLNNTNSANNAQTKAMGEQFAKQNGTKDEVKEDRKVLVVDGNAAQ